MMHRTEQLAHAISGGYQTTVAGEEGVLTPDQLLVIAPRTPHGGHALEDTRLFEVHFEKDMDVIADSAETAATPEHPAPTPICDTAGAPLASAFLRWEDASAAASPSVQTVISPSAELSLLTIPVGCALTRSAATEAIAQPLSGLVHAHSGSAEVMLSPDWVAVIPAGETYTLTGLHAVTRVLEVVLRAKAD
jgi:hypothetical protein